MQIYITKYALTKGILVGDTATEDSPTLQSLKSYPHIYYHPDEYAYSEDAALEIANLMASKRIKSLEKSIQKLKSFKAKIITEL